MIKAVIRSTLESEITTDYLGGGEIERGEERTDTYPGVEVVFFDSDIGSVDDESSHRGIAHYFLRPGSALETMDDVRERIRVEIAKLESQNSDVAELPPKPRSATTQTKIHAKIVGEEIT